MSFHSLPCRVIEGMTRGEYVVLRTVLADQYCWVCPYCSKPLPAPNGQWDRQQATVDHLEPRTNGGGDEWDNLVPACLRCNSSKADKTLLVFLLQKRW